MTGFSELLQQTAGNAWLFVPSAILLGALHGLEPGHSKTMMAAFIVAVRGTVRQAILLALSATASHTAIVWVCALVALTYGKNWSEQANEPYFQIASGGIIVGMALWMLYRTWRDQQRVKQAAAHGHHHGERRRLETGHETRFIEHSHGESRPHERIAPNAVDFEDAHQRAHSREIRQRFASQGTATTGQVIVFGLTGGLLPCPAAITVLLLCLQLHRFWLGIVLVLCFSIGLALTLVLSGIAAAWGTRHVVRRWKGLDAFTQRAPYFAGILITCIGLYVGLRGLLAL